MNRKTQQIIHFVVSTFLLLIPAFYNGYPLVFADTGQYVLSSVDLIPPSTSPMGYIFFVRIFAWNESLWIVIFAQAAIVNFLIYKTVKILILHNRHLYHFAIVAFLSIFTGASWYSSQIMPDIFAPILVLSIFVFLNYHKSLWMNIGLILILIITCISHFTYLYTCFLTSFVFFVFLFYNRKKIPMPKIIINKLIGIFLIVVSSYYFTPTYNYLHGNDFNSSKIKHVLLMAKLVENGVAKEFLDNNCHENRYCLCDYKDNLPTNPPAFVWRAESPFFKTGGWSNSKLEYEEIISIVFSDPGYLSMFIYKGFISTIKLLTINELGSSFSEYRENSTIYNVIQKEMPHELNEFKNARQYNKKLSFTFINLFLNLFLVLSVIIIYFSFRKGFFKGNLELQSLIIVVISAVIFNAAISGSFSAIAPRYQSRISWLVILVALIILINYFSKFKTIFHAKK
ncbi:MAG: hypothetical protein JXR58_05205 [Bacteroidales bacterium]|nr:hypothetical protein [Bacteroidales bacterium]